MKKSYEKITMEGWFGDRLASTAKAAGFDSRALRTLTIPGDHMSSNFTEAQIQRLREVGADVEGPSFFQDESGRDRSFEEIVQHRTDLNRRSIRESASSRTRHPIQRLEDAIAQRLVSDGFLEVRTPTLMSAEGIRKMGITEIDPLWKQIFWLEDGRCMRPMLAPNLYFVMRHLKRSVGLPLKLFEVGPCYRRESHGSMHLEEFTMLNLVELGPNISQKESLEWHVKTVMNAVGSPFSLEIVPSEVYGDTVDVLINGEEVASGATGPHPLDKAFGITDSWAGVGFGIERLECLRKNFNNIKRVGRSLIYQAGARIDI
jgi:phenylalanyl-tRNA synthetase alpha chain